MLPAGLLPNANARLVTALFLGTTLSISSVKIVAMVVRELDFQRRNIGQILLASSILDDTIAWILLGIISSFAAKGAVDLPSLLRSVVGTALFLALSFTIGRQIVFRLIRFTNDSFLSEVPVISAIVALMGVMALITDWIGVHTVLGAFVAGMLIGDSPILTRQIDAQLRALITALFMPVFFGLSGLSADLRVLADPTMLLLTVGIVLIASVGKFTGAFVGGWLGGLSSRECLALGCGMNARGSTEVIIATIGLSLGVLDRKFLHDDRHHGAGHHARHAAHAALGAVASSADRRRGGAPQARGVGGAQFRRQSGEAVDRRRQVGERPVRNPACRPSRREPGAAGDGAAPRLARCERRSRAVGGPGEASARREPEGGGRVDQGKGNRPPKSAAAPPIEVTLRHHAAPIQEAIAAEAGKGYDLLVVGIDRPVAPDGRFRQDLTDIAAAFEGPLAIADARGVHMTSPSEPD